MTYSDDHLRDILTRVNTIACVGASPNPVRPSHYVSRYLGEKGYRVYPVNPGLAGQTLLGETVVSDLADLATASPPVDMVDIFRRSEHVPAIVETAIAQFAPGVIWMQIGVEHAEAAQRAEAAGWTVIQNRCPKVEYHRLFGERRKQGSVIGDTSGIS